MSRKTKKLLLTSNKPNITLYVVIRSCTQTASVTKMLDAYSILTVFRKTMEDGLNPLPCVVVQDHRECGILQKRPIENGIIPFFVVSASLMSHTQPAIVQIDSGHETHLMTCQRSDLCPLTDRYLTPGTISCAGRAMTRPSARQVRPDALLLSVIMSK